MCWQFHPAYAEPDSAALGSIMYALISGLQWSRFSRIQNDILVSMKLHIYGLLQDCRNSCANTLELLQACAKPSI